MAARMIERIADALERLDPDTLRLVRDALEQGEAPLAVIERGIVVGINRCGDRLTAYEYGVPELLVAGELAQECVNVVRPFLEPGSVAKKATVVLATVQGDIHELGKNLVALLLDLSGYEVVDLGVDVAPMAIIERAEAAGADVIGLSSLMVTTMPAQQEVITYLKDLGVREDYLVLVGGAPTSQEWADSIGADGWAPDARTTVQMMEGLCRERRAP
jgi:5-methyltetrahydrofolate--homocysteine methyltransferase